MSEVNDQAGPQPTRAPEQTTSGWRSVAVLVVSVLVLGVCITWAFLAMRAVTGVGGACADGAPYVSAQPCPDGAGLIAIAIPVMIITAMVGSAVALSHGAPELLIPCGGSCSARWAGTSSSRPSSTTESSGPGCCAARCSG